MLHKLIVECSDYDFKEKLEINKPKSWLKSVSAFANGIGGTLFFGIADDKNLVGIDNHQYICEKISELINSRIDPIPTYTINPYSEDGVIFLALNVSPGPLTPYCYSSNGITEAYIRCGNQTIKAPGYVYAELVLKGKNKTYDSLITHYLKKDYSFTFFEATFFERTLTRIKNSDYISFSLATDDGYLTNAGVLFSDQNIYRHNRIFCTRWNGLTKTSLEEASDDNEYTGGIVKLLDSALNFVKINTKKKWKKEPSGRVEMPEYDEIAVKETIVNALIHRQYTNLGSEVTVDIYDDRIEITSPGPLASGHQINKEIKNTIPSIRKNPILADVFVRMKYMDRRGSGFDKIINGTNRLFKDNNNHVEIFATDIYFRVVIYNANYEIDNINGNTNDDINGDINLTKNAKIILKAIIENPCITRYELAKIINKSERTIDRLIKELKLNGYISEKEIYKTGNWKIIK